MDINLTIPTNWNELSQQQAKNISYIIHCTQRSIINLPHQEFAISGLAYVKCAKELLRHNKYKAIRIALQELTLSAYKPFVQFLFKNVELQEFPDTYKFKKTTLHAPAVRLRNLTVEEFSFADALYFRYKTTNDVKYLDLLCSTLYRPEATAPNPTDIRTPYNRLLAETHYDNFKNLPLKEKIVVAFAFEGSRNHLVNQFPNVFPKAKTSANPKAKPTTPKYTPIGQLISNKIDYDPSKLQIANQTNVYSFFSVYEAELIEIKKIKRQNRNKK